MSKEAPTPYAELAAVVENVGLLTREARRARGLSIRAAAKEAGMSFTTLSRAERGDDLRAETLAAILRWLDRTTTP